VGFLNAESERRLLIASPRGFCAGVERAIEVVQQLLEKCGRPLFVRKEIVHNKAVVQDFRARGVVFVEELDEVPDGQTVVFSAHGVSPDVRRQAQNRGLRVVDATCPLVTKVHREVLGHDRAGRRIILIGHAGHDEVLGTTGEAPEAITLVTSVGDVEQLDIPPETPIAYVTQTTLSVDETREIVDALRRRFTDLHEPRTSDICYATQNRQDAVKELVNRGIGHLLVVGSANSSNSRRLCEVAQTMGIAASLIDDSAGLPWDLLADLRCLGLTAGASAPEHLVRDVVARLQDAGWQAEEVLARQEDVKFQLPKELSLYSES
jgi:4-hydroxy-3-methylbut-2-enyl diphosphate reductase